MARGEWAARVAVVLIALPLAAKADWNCKDPVLARPIQSIKCGTSPPAGKVWPLCPKNPTAVVGFGFFSLELASGDYTGLFTIAASTSEGGTGVLYEVLASVAQYTLMEHVNSPTQNIIHQGLILQNLPDPCQSPLTTSCCRSTAAALAPSTPTPTAWRAPTHGRTPTALQTMDAGKCLSVSDPSTRIHLTHPLTMSRGCIASVA